MNVLIDTNVILDDLLNRAPNSYNAQYITQMITDDIIVGHLTANTLTDIFYVVEKARDSSVAKKAIQGLLLSFKVICVDGRDCQMAIDLPVSDFEDAVVIVCATRECLDYIITNDSRFLEQTGLTTPVVSPEAFLRSFI